MCGISGKLHFNLNNPISDQSIYAMITAFRHRGPDSDGVWTDGRCGLGQQRLAIVDLSPTGYQPMSNHDGSIWITYNGEIYNHPELRLQLEAKEYTYRGTSDTETILYLYEEHGRDCIQYLRGMFALAIWDQRKQSLLLARDRFGQKPLVYAQTADSLLFASELRALFQDPQVSRDIDPIALDQYLTYGFVPHPRTIFQDIKKLPPAHTLWWENGNISIEKYWQLDYRTKLKIDEETAAKELLAHLRKAVSLRLMSDVPLGAFLSGGIDSSAVVALMAEASSTRIKTFSIGFSEQSFNETPYARKVAEQYDCEHHEFIVTPDVIQVLPELVWGYGEPFADSSAVPSYYVAKMTRQHVTVALNGDGGDEAFAGYDRYYAQMLSGTYEKIPSPIRKYGLEPLARLLPEPHGRRNLIRRTKNFILAQSATPEDRYTRWLTLMPEQIKNTLYTDEFHEKLGAHQASHLMQESQINALANTPLDKLLASDVAYYLPDDLLTKVDITTMLHSLEGRSPFLDHKLAEFAAQLPAEYKLKGRNKKAILKKALENHLPHDILYREKSGFAIPLGRWIQQDIKQTIHDTLLNPTAVQRGIFDTEKVKQLLDQHHTGKANHRYPIWQLFMLELWFRTYIDRPRSELGQPSTSLW